jgi:hypothetical protein
VGCAVKHVAVEVDDSDRVDVGLWGTVESPAHNFVEQAVIAVYVDGWEAG